MRKAGLLLAAAAFVAALVGASTAQASKFIQKGIYDDAQVLYGNPDKTFPILQQMGTRLVRVNLWWGGPNGVARSKPLNPANPADPAYDWATYDRTVRYASAYKMATIFTVIGTPDWANGGKGWNRAPTRTADLQSFVTAAARRYSGTFKGPDGAIDRPREQVDRLERAEQPGLPQAAVRPLGLEVGDPERQGLRQDVQRRRQGGEDRALHQPGRLRRHLAEGQQPARDACGHRCRRSPSCAR